MKANLDTDTMHTRTQTLFEDHFYDKSALSHFEVLFNSFKKAKSIALITPLRKNFLKQYKKGFNFLYLITHRREVRCVIQMLDHSVKIVGCNDGTT